VQENAREVAAYDEQIANQANATARVDPAITKLKKGIDSHSDLLSNLRRQRPRSEQEVEEAEKAFDAAKEAESRAHEEAMQALRAEHESKEAVDNLRLQATNRLAAFGHNISIVMQEIDRARWVHSKPLGPLGMHVRLKDLKYRNAFHSVFGSTLCQFAVQCDQDRKTMMDILKRCKAK
jgi:chromosome segregation ATPase